MISQRSWLCPRGLSLLCIVLIAVAGLSGCARKSGETGSIAFSDSAVVSNPTERASGQITPQGRPPAPAPPAAPRPKTTAKPRAAAPAAATTAAPAPAPSSPATRKSSGPAMNVKWGTGLLVTVADGISSETAKVGDEWSGTLRSAVIADEREAFPAGSPVHGKVKDVKAAEKGDRALLTLEVTAVEAYDQSWPMSATAEPLLADSPRARNLGGVAGGAAAGALLGGAVGGEKGAVIGGLLGGGAAGGAVARSKGYQVVVKPGTTLRFTLAGDVIVRP
jgi:hypothetical protein